MQPGLYINSVVSILKPGLESLYINQHILV